MLDLFNTSKFGPLVQFSYVSTDVYTGYVNLPTGRSRAMFWLRATGAIRFKQGDSSVTISSDACRLPSDCPFPMVVESDEDKYFAVQGDGNNGTLEFTLASDTASFTITSTTPSVSFSGDTVVGIAPLTVAFTNATTGATSYSWDFKNDGSATSTQTNPSYTYTTGGIFSVKLIATGATSSARTTMTDYITAATPMGIVPGGLPAAAGADALSSMQKWTFADSTWAATTSMSGKRFYQMLLGIAQFAYMFGGEDETLARPNVTYRFSFANEAIVASTSLTTSRDAGSASNNSTVGIIFSGSSGSTPYLTSCEKFTFATETISAATALSGAGRCWGSAAGNATAGIFRGGDTSVASAQTTSDKYTYATDTQSAGTALQQGTHGVAAAANTTTGIWAGGWVFNNVLRNVQIYTFADDSVSQNANGLAVGREYAAGFGNATYAMFAGGNPYPDQDATTGTQTVNYGENTSTVAAAMAVAARCTAGVSNQHGGL